LPELFEKALYFLEGFFDDYYCFKKKCMIDLYKLSLVIGK